LAHSKSATGLSCQVTAPQNTQRGYEFLTVPLSFRDTQHKIGAMKKQLLTLVLTENCKWLRKWRAENDPHRNTTKQVSIICERKHKGAAADRKFKMKE